MMIITLIDSCDISTGVIRLRADNRCKRSLACCSTAITNASWTALPSSPAIFCDADETNKRNCKIDNNLQWGIQQSIKTERNLNAKEIFHQNGSILDRCIFHVPGRCLKYANHKFTTPYTTHSYNLQLHSAMSNECIHIEYQMEFSRFIYYWMDY